MTSKAARRRAKQSSVRQMQADWQRDEPPTAPPQDDPTRTVLAARCLRLGLDDTKGNRRRVAWAGGGDPAGQAIALAAVNRDERDALWTLFADLDSAHEVYHRRIIGRPRFPACTKLEFLPERFETRADYFPDIRPAAERDESARLAWRHWLALTNQCSVQDRMSLWDGLWLRCPLSDGATLTAAGACFVAALRQLREVEQRA